MLETEENSGIYEKSTSSTWPGEGYVFNSELSRCENGGELEWDEELGTVKLKTNKSDACYVYFDIFTRTPRTSEEMLAALGLIINSDTPDFTKTSCTNGTNISNVDEYSPEGYNCGEETVGVYMAEDDLGTSYYFRGDVKNNYVYFAGYYWRIIRINGDGTLRLIYDGTTVHENGEVTDDKGIGLSAYSVDYPYDNAYVGYMYGTIDANNYIDTHNNTNNSTIKTVVDNWYINNIANKNEYSDLVADAIYCNDRGIVNGGGVGYGKETTWYDAYYRLRRSSAPKNPTLKCNQINDRFSVSNNVSNFATNGDLTYPIGLITADEIAFAGAISTSMSGDIYAQNYSYYLYSGYYVYSMTPDYLGSATLPMMFTIGSVPSSDGMSKEAGKLDTLSSTYENSLVRPVISLISSVKISGNGTINNPYILS